MFLIWCIEFHLNTQSFVVNTLLLHILPTLRWILGIACQQLIWGYPNAFSWLSEIQVAEIEINIDFLQHFGLLLLQQLAWAA